MIRQSVQGCAGQGNTQRALVNAFSAAHNGMRAVWRASPALLLAAHPGKALQLW